jgi:hypothetical protein
MAETPLAKKLAVKSGYRVLLLNAPEGYRARLEPLPAGTMLAETAGAADAAFDAALTFVRDTAELARLAPVVLAAVPRDRLLWFAYPKRSAKVATDLTRDVGWETLRAAGLQAVSLVAIDDTWAALRFRPIPAGQAPR